MSADAGDTRIGRAVSPRIAANPRKSGVHPLPDPGDAFSARMSLALAAERTLDVQYYIWNADMSGILLFEALHGAAERGVRVRLLLDDNHTGGLDETLAALDAHPNIRVRLFNPFPNRGHRWAGFLSDFRRLNRRMHNKMFTADGRATIVGGRNVGDEYFGAAGSFGFVDLDVMAIGPVVEEASREFDRYWDSAASCPAGRLLPPSDPRRLQELVSRRSLIERDPSARAYVEALRESPFVREMLEGRLPFLWAETRMVSDDPAKALGRDDDAALLSRQLARIIGKPGRSVDLVSPYFVPAGESAEGFARLARDGVKVRILTNSLEATDVAVVHAGYARRRKALLEAGIELYELRRASADAGRSRGSGTRGRSASSLHAKTFSVDRSRVFIGSFNFDPRSARLNTELGFVIESPELACRVADAFDSRVPPQAYEVRLSEKGKPYWLETRDGGTIRHDTEPGAGPWKRAWVRLASLLPIEWLP